MSAKEIIMLTFAGSLFLTVFGFGLRATLEDVLYVFRRPGLLFRSLLAMFVIMPLAVLAFVRLFDAPLPVEIVMTALAISPIPPLLPKKMRKTGATGGYGIGLLVVASVLSIVIVPVAVHLLGQYFHRPFAMPASAIAMLIGRTVLLPLIVGMLVKQLLPGVANRIEKPAEVIAAVVLTVAALIVIGSSLSAIWSLVSPVTVALIAAFIATGLAVGTLLGGAPVEDQGILALATASRHPGIALALANANFPGERFGGIILLYLVMSAILCIPYIKWGSARAAATA